MNLDEFPEWSDTLDSVCTSGGSVLLIGGTDTGKTTFAGLLANAVVSRGRIAAVVDADLGQSEIGPPGCVGLGIVSESINSLGDLKPAGLAFVGSTAPRGCMLEHVVAVRRMADQAIERNPEVLIVDTTGFIQGLS